MWPIRGARGGVAGCPGSWADAREHLDAQEAPDNNGWLGSVRTYGKGGDFKALRRGKVRHPGGPGEAVREPPTNRTGQFRTGAGSRIREK